MNLPDSPTSKEAAPKLITLGLDGACWPLLQPWLEQGKLPNLKHLRDESVWGALDSQFPPVTSPNWRCYATGKNPGKQGVFWWEVVDMEQKSIRHPSANDFDGTPFWEDLSTNGLQTAAINFPTGYPPVEIANMKFSAGGPGAKEQGFATPTAWEKHLKEKYHYRVHPKPVIYSRQQVESHYPEIEDLIRTRFEVALDLLNEGLDFLHITIFYINVLQHFCYRQDPTLRAWQLIDDYIGRLHHYARENEASLFLMSDHGCGPVDTVFYVNTWLASEGYLSVKPSGSDMSARFGFNKQQAINLARRLGVASFLRDIIPRRLQNALPSVEGTFDKEAKATRIDWERSRALASGQGLIYLSSKPDQPDYYELRAEIATGLVDLTNPFTGTRIVKNVHFKEDVYSGPYLERAPDIVFEQGNAVFTSGGVGHAEIFARPEKWAADNLPQGFFLAYGAIFSRGQNVEGVNIIDLAPTILHAMDQEIPNDMDGRVRLDLFKTGSEPGKREIRFREPSSKPGPRLQLDDKDSSVLGERLKDLGYLE